MREYPISSSGFSSSLVWFMACCRKIWSSHNYSEEIETGRTKVAALGWQRHYMEVFSWKWLTSTNQLFFVNKKKCYFINTGPLETLQPWVDGDRVEGRFSTPETDLILAAIKNILHLNRSRLITITHQTTHRGTNNSGQKSRHLYHRSSVLEYLMCNSRNHHRAQGRLYWKPQKDPKCNSSEVADYFKLWQTIQPEFPWSRRNKRMDLLRLLVLKQALAKGQTSPDFLPLWIWIFYLVIVV